MIKKENLILTLMFTVMLIISAVLISVQDAYVASTPIDKMFNQKTRIEVDTNADINDSAIITAQHIVYSLNGQELATLYTANANNVYADMELYVAIDETGNVYAIDKTATAKDDTSESYLPLVREYLLSNYNGLWYRNIQYIDGAAGGTTIEVSRGLIKQTVQYVINHHTGDDIDYIEGLIGSADYTRVNETTTNGVLISEITFSGETYHVYMHTLEGEYVVAGPQTGEITVLVAVDDSGIVTHVDMPQNLYGHSLGSFYETALSYLQNIIGESLNNLTIPDAGSGVTGSSSLIASILEDIKEALV